MHLRKTNFETKKKKKVISDIFPKFHKVTTIIWCSFKMWSPKLASSFFLLVLAASHSNFQTKNTGITSPKIFVLNVY